VTTTSQLLAAGPGWRVSDVLCSAGPRDRPFEERHDSVCIAVVTHGTFQYRSPRGAALLAPGTLLLGNEGECFECGHEHAAGDRCLAFHYAPERLAAIVAELPGVTRTEFALPRLPPLPGLTPLLAAAEAARDERDAAALEEVAIDLAGAVAANLADATGGATRPSRHDAGRVTDALRRIEAASEEPIALAELARETAMSPFHFLRTFRQVVGVTPHQFVLRTRLHRAAVRLRRTTEPVATIAFECGFNDLSTFNHRFRNVMGVSPRAYRARANARL
jgi:AraC family transcriptional regulator